MGANLYPVRIFRISFKLNTSCIVHRRPARPLSGNTRLHGFIHSSRYSNYEDKKPERGLPHLMATTVPPTLNPEAGDYD